MLSKLPIELQKTSYRNRALGGITATEAGETLQLCGWVHRRRDLGGLYFIDLRDRSGLLQVSVGPDWTDAESLAVARDLGAEAVIEVEGEITLRPEEARNPDMATGEVELKASRVRLLNDAVTPAIPVDAKDRVGYSPEITKGRFNVDDVLKPIYEEAGRALGREFEYPSND